LGGDFSSRRRSHGKAIGLAPTYIAQSDEKSQEDKKEGAGGVRNRANMIDFFYSLAQRKESIKKKKRKKEWIKEKKKKKCTCWKRKPQSKRKRKQAQNHFNGALTHTEAPRT